jgi:hypothetical protein
MPVRGFRGVIMEDGWEESLGRSDEVGFVVQMEFE